MRNGAVKQHSTQQRQTNTLKTSKNDGIILEGWSRMEMENVSKIMNGVRSGESNGVSPSCEMSVCERH